MCCLTSQQKYIETLWSLIDRFMALIQHIAYLSYLKLQIMQNGTPVFKDTSMQEIFHLILEPNSWRQTVATDLNDLGAICQIHALPISTCNIQQF